MAYVGVGSNIQPDQNVVRALESLSGSPEIHLLGISTFYRTAPLPDPSNSHNLPDQESKDFDPDFLNRVLEIRTSLSPDDLLNLFHRTENALGRDRMGGRYAPRTMDLDLLLYGWVSGEDTGVVWEEIGDTDALVHRDIQTRPFVAFPLFELAPDLLLPPHGTPLRAFTASFGSPGGKAEPELTDSLRKRFLPS